MTELERAKQEGREIVFQRVIVNLAKEGESIALIARVVGKSPKAVEHILEKMDVPPPPTPLKIPKSPHF